jgi:hypothetical protein
VVRLESLPKSIEPLGDGFAGTAGKRLGTGVDLDAGKDALL